MKVAVFGSGYVGLVTGACLANVGNHVTCVDVDENNDSTPLVLATVYLVPGKRMLIAVAS